MAFGFHAATHPVSQVNDWKKASQIPSFPVHKSHIRSKKGWEGEREGSAGLGALESHQQEWQFQPGGTDSTLRTSILPQPLPAAPTPSEGSVESAAPWQRPWHGAGSEGCVFVTTSCHQSRLCDFPSPLLSLSVSRDAPSGLWFSLRYLGLLLCLLYIYSLFAECLQVPEGLLSFWQDFLGRGDLKRYLQNATVLLIVFKSIADCQVKGRTE